MTTPTTISPPGDLTDQAQLLQLVSFEVGDEEFAVDILAVQEIIRMTVITGVPQTPPSVEGVVNFRGQITPVVDLRKRFGLTAQKASDDSRIIIVEIKKRMLGFIVDKVNQVLRLDPSCVDPSPNIHATADSQYIRGVGKLENRLLILLDLPSLFDQSQFQQLRDTAEAA